MSLFGPSAHLLDWLNWVSHSFWFLYLIKKEERIQEFSLEICNVRQDAYSDERQGMPCLYHVFIETMGALSILLFSSMFFGNKGCGAQLSCSIIGSAGASAPAA